MGWKNYITYYLQSQQIWVMRTTYNVLFALSAFLGYTIDLIILLCLWVIQTRIRLVPLL